MPIFSRKYGRTFRNRSELARYQWRDRQTKPVFSWIGLRDAPYSDEWRREHGLPTRSERWKVSARLLIAVGVVWIMVMVGMCSRG